MTNPSLPQWAIDDGWTEADMADGWQTQCDQELYFEFNCGGKNPAIYVSDDSQVSVVDVWDGEPEHTIDLVYPGCPATARQCALDIVAAVKRARGEQG